MSNYRVRPLSHAGRLPEPSLLLGEDRLIKIDGLIFSCTKNFFKDRFGHVCEPEQPAFELDNWTLQEVRFFAAVMLGSGPGLRPSPYPLPISQDLFVPSCDYIYENVSILDALRGKMQNDGYFMRWNADLVPKHYDEYEIGTWNDRDASNAERVWRSIDLNDNVLLRGLHAFVKAQMVINHFQFADAALSYSHISLDALFSLISKRLKALGISNPTATEAAQYIQNAFGYPETGLRFFQDYYDDRIRNFHPDNRLGSEAIPFFSRDDAYDLWHHLKDVYFYFLTGDLYEDTRRELDRYKRDMDVFNDNLDDHR